MTPTDTVVSEERLREHKPWPLLGYAPGSYSCLCSICSREFIGDKRASMCLECAAQGARELLDRRTATPQSGGVVVEGLEWEHIEDSDLRGGETFIAVTVFGKYQVWGDGVWSDPHNFHDPVPGFPAGYWNATTGKAAASAHYEARILSTLADPIPEAPADEEVEGTPEARELRKIAERLGCADDPFAAWETLEVVLNALAFYADNRTYLELEVDEAERLYPGKTVHNMVNRKSLFKFEASAGRAVPLIMSDWGDKAREATAALRRSTETDKPGVREAYRAHLSDLDALRAYAGKAGHMPLFDLISKDMRVVDQKLRALAASPLTEEQPVAEGWKLVPVEPTEAMTAGAIASYHRPPADAALATEHVAKVFRAMLAAAPLPRSTTGGAK